MRLMRRSRAFGHGVMASRFVTLLWLCSQLCCEIAANQRTLFEIELLATVGWKCSCQPFSCRCYKMWLTATGDFWDMLVFRNPFPPFNLGIPSIHSLRCSYRKGICLMQRSRVFGHGVMASRFVTILWLCSQLSCEIAANQRTLFEIELLATVGWKCGCQPFSCRCSLNVTQWETRLVGHGCFRNPFLPFPFWNSKHPLPTRRRFLRAAVSSTCFGLWLHHAHPFVAAAGKNLFL